MTKTVEEVRREVFLKWWDSLARKWEEESAKVSAWQAFNAALDAVEIELPEPFTYWSDIGCEPSDPVMDAAEVRAAIEQIGLGLRIK